MFNYKIEGSYVFCDLLLFLCCILCLGKSLHVMCILPIGILGLLGYYVKII